MRLPTRLSLAGMLLLVLVGVKLASLAIYGPFRAPDTSGYLQIADILAASWDWTATVDLGTRQGALLSSRMLGYPAVIAVARAVFGAEWAYVVCAVQVLAGCLAVWMLYALTVRLIRDRTAALLVAAAYGTGLVMVYDQALLTDGLHASLLVVFIAGIGCLAGRRRDIWLLLPGCAAAAALLLRESTLGMLGLLLPAALALAGGPDGDMRTRGRRIVVALLPVVMTAASYAGWNVYRTGKAFLTTGLAAASLIPVIHMRRMGALVFDADTPFEAGARRALSKWQTEEVYSAVASGSESADLDPLEAQRAARESLARAIREAPLAYLRHVVSELHPKYLVLSFVPFGSAAVLAGSSDGRLSSIGEARDRLRNGERLTVLALLGISAVVALALWLGMIAVALAVAQRWVRGRTPSTAELAVLALAAFHVGLMLLYALVHTESRYLLAAQFVPPLAVAVGWKAAAGAATDGASVVGGMRNLVRYLAGGSG